MKSLGVNVTAVCDTANMDLVKGLGADRVIDYTTEDFTKDDQTYDVVLDSVGKSSFSQCRPLLKPAGIYISSELGSACPESVPGAHRSTPAGQEGHVPHPEA